MELLYSFASSLRQLTSRAFGPDERQYWVWLTFALIAIDLFYRLANRPRSESFPAPWRIYTHPSAILDYKFVVVQRLVIAFVTTPLLVSAIALGKLQAAALTAWLGPGPAWLAGPWALLAFAAIGLVLSDIGHYISHYMQHKIPFFWEFHKIHHAAEVLTPVTAARVHPVENLLDSILLAPLEALELGAFFYLYGTEQSVMTIVGMTLLFPLYYLVDSIRHSHLRISFGPILEHIFSSPAQHQIHHSRAPQHLDTNFSRHLSLLDWMAGTLYISKAGETLDFGLADGPDSELNSVRSLYWVPMKRAFRLVFRPYAPPAQIVSGD